jgi:two-component system, cell cycle sensor histidine kinase and response regulator CckA
MALACGPAPAVAAELQVIRDGAGRGAALIRQLLSLVRRQPAAPPEALSLNDAVRGATRLLARLAGGRIRLDLTLEEPGPAVRIEPVQFDRVLLNLAANARNAMPEGGVLRIATRRATLLRPHRDGAETIPPGRWVVLELSDTGPGIAPDALPRIFEPFFSTRLDSGGTGLGLATVRDILRQAGGYVSAESRPGEGATFRLWLPAAGTAVAADDAPPRRPQDDVVATTEPMPVVDASRGPILLVEDESAVRRLAELALRAAGFIVTAAEGGEAALAALSEDGPPPLALVSDVSMAGMDGLELARRLRQRYPLLPVVFVSGYAGPTLGPDAAAEEGGAFPRQAVRGAGVGGGGRHGPRGGTMTGMRGGNEPAEFTKCSCFSDRGRTYSKRFVNRPWATDSACACLRGMEASGSGSRYTA